jgi:tetratricopeptide (TPR) repeat protein
MSASAFVGRAREIEQLRASLEDAMDGLGGLALLRGEAGIGKTRLVMALAEQAERSGVVVLSGRCWDDGGAPSGWPFIELLQEANALEELAPAHAPLAEALDRLRGPCLAEQRLAVFDAVARALAVAASVKPLLLFLDDLHWADSWTLELSRLVSRRLQRARVLVVGAYRSLEARLSPEALRLLTDLSRDGRVIDLGALSREDVRAWTASVGIGGPMNERIHARAAGHPFYVSQLVQWVAAGGVVDDVEPLPLTDGVRSMIDQRLSLLSVAAQRALGVAAAIGSEIDPSLLREALAPLPLVDVDDAIDALCRHDVLLSSGGRLRFAHDLIRDAVLSRPGERVEAHRAVADALERRGGTPAERARHLLACGDVRAVELAVEGGRRARQRGDDAEAATLLETALTARRSLGVAFDRSEVELAIEAAEAALRAGRVVRGSERCVEAAELARGVSEPELLARAALAYGTVVRFGRVDATLVTLLSDALAAVAPDSALALTLEARLAAAMQPSPTPEMPLARARAAIDRARARGDRELLLRVIDLARPAFRALDGLDERQALDEEALELGRAVGGAGVALRAEHRLVVDLLERGEVEAFDQLGERVARAAREGGALPLLVNLEMLRVSRACLVGAHDDAERAARRAAEQYLALPNPESLLGLNPLPLIRLMMIYNRRRTTEQIEAQVDAASAGPFCDVLITAMSASAGQLETARAALERVVARGDHTRLNYLPAALLPEAIAILGDAPRAAVMLPITRALSDRNVVQFAGICEGAGARLAGLLATTLGRYDEAESWFAQAMAMNEAMDAKPYIHATELAHAQMLHHRDAEGDRQRAAVLAQRAMEGFATLGMTASLERARRLAGSEPVGAPGFSRAAFSRDGEIWTLTHAGRAHRFKDAHGLHYIAHLLERPNADVHVEDLAAIIRGAAPSGDAGPLIDARAKADYRRRVAELREEIDEATVFNDLGRADAARRELELIMAELERAVGKGGRDRRSSTTERTRVNVTMRIRKAIQKIAEVCPEIGDHLQRNISTGAFCAYRPPPALPLVVEV